MPRFAANISTMFTELPFLDRVAAAHAAGFDAIECQFPYEEPAERLKERLDATGVRLVLINTPPGDFAAGERGLSALPGRQDDFRAAMEKALDYAKVLNVPAIHVMAGIEKVAARRPACLAIYRSNLRIAAELALKAGRRALIEPINDVDIPGYLLNTPDQAAEIIEAVGHSNLQLQFDFYHCQMMVGRLADRLRTHLPRIGHVQFAGVPGRHEPDVGEIDFPYLFALLDEVGYAGWVGAEYTPKGRTEDGLAWARAQGIRPRSADSGS